MKFNYIDLLRYAENNPGNDIYYHPQKTWWTHTLDDVKQSSEMAVMFVKNKAEEMLADDTVDTETKEKVKDHVSKMEDPDFKIMLCPDGCPMYKVNVVKFVIDNLNKLSRLGEHGMLTLLAAHHQNCDGIITEDWKDLDPVVEAHIKENGHSRTLDNDDSIEAFDESLALALSRMPFQYWSDIIKGINDLYLEEVAKGEISPEEITSNPESL